MKDKKGFTLAELLGVITLLGIIAAITVPLVNSYISSSREKTYNSEIGILTDAAKQWLTKNYGSVEWDENGYALSLDDLKKTEFLADEPIKNPMNPDLELNGCIMIKKDNDIYDYSYSEECSWD